MKIRMSILAMSLAGLLLLVEGLGAIGCGGLLNLVPQAQVWIEDASGKREPVDYSVFVHPMEGSLVLLREGDGIALGLDKNKRHAVEVPVSALSLSADGSILDVPEDTPATTLRNAPHFNRTHASLRLNDGTLLIVSVSR